MNRSRVLFVVDALEIGGVASHLSRSIGRISRSRYDLRVVNLGAAAAARAQLMDVAVWAPRLDELYASVIRSATAA